MIDLKKLQDKFDVLFSVENESTFNQWLDNKIKTETISSLGEGVIQNLGNCENYPQFVQKEQYSLPLLLESNLNWNLLVGNTQYAMAA